MLLFGLHDLGAKAPPLNSGEKRRRISVQKVDMPCWQKRWASEVNGSETQGSGRQKHSQKNRRETPGTNAERMRITTRPPFSKPRKSRNTRLNITPSRKIHTTINKPGLIGRPFKLKWLMEPSRCDRLPLDGHGVRTQCYHKLPVKMFCTMVVYIHLHRDAIIILKLCCWLIIWRYLKVPGFILSWVRRSTICLAKSKCVRKAYSERIIPWWLLVDIHASIPVEVKEWSAYRCKYRRGGVTRMIFTISPTTTGIRFEGVEWHYMPHRARKE